MATVFANSDAKYQQWLKDHPAGFVINTRRRGDPDYLVLHRSLCPSITQYHKTARPGAFTERAYIKVCADDVRKLRGWIKENGRPDGSFSSECALCKPL